MAHILARLGLGSAFVVAAVLGFGSSARAVPQAESVIDMTFGCLPVPLTGNVRTVDVHAYPVGAMEAHNGAENRSPGFIGIGSGGWEPGADLVSVRARAWQRFRSNVSAEGVYASIRRCSASRLKVVLSPNGLPGAPVRWSRRVTCLGRGRVIVRVRATLRSGAFWQPLINQSSDGARGGVVEARLAIRSERTGKPIAYLELARDGTTKLWTSPRCVS